MFGTTFWSTGVPMRKLWRVAVLGMVLLHARPPLPALLGRPLLRDFGSLMLAFLMVWAYLSFSQFLLIWSGNLPEEVAYYQRRSQGGWEYVAGAIPFSRYGRFTRWIVLRTARRKGRDLDPARDYEFTDWDAVDELARRFTVGVETKVA